jgi:hypothetical protein
MYTDRPTQHCPKQFAIETSLRRAKMDFDLDLYSVWWEHQRRQQAPTAESRTGCLRVPDRRFSRSRIRYFGSSTSRQMARLLTPAFALDPGLPDHHPASCRPTPTTVRHRGRRCRCQGLGMPPVGVVCLHDSRPTARGSAQITEGWPFCRAGVRQYRPTRSGRL